ncbi:MAG: hypothetical protein V2G44_08330 [bacterium JZ-2024 1]
MSVNSGFLATSEFFRTHNFGWCDRPCRAATRPRATLGVLTGIGRHETDSQTGKREDTPVRVWTALAKSLPAIAGVPGVLWLYASCQTARMPVRKRLTLQAEDFELTTVPGESLLTLINVEWILRLATEFLYGQVRFRVTCEKLVSSAYFPTPSTRTNPYPHRAMTCSRRRGIGDIRGN